MSERKIKVADLNQYLKDNDLILTLAQKLAGISDGTGEPCPFCGGEDRFYYGADSGKFYCRTCMPNGRGHSIYDLIMHYHGIDFKESLKMTAIKSGFLDSEQYSEEFHTFDLNENAKAYQNVHKHRPEIDLSTYYKAGALEFVDENGIGVAIPIFDTLGNVSGYVRYYARGGRPMNSEGSKSGIVGQDSRDALLQKRQVKIVFKCAGTSDYLVMSRLIAESCFEADYYAFTNACGENENPGKFDPILCPALEGQTVAIIRDNDAAGEAGAKKWAKHLATYAADVRIICPPQEWNGTPIKDLRDFVAAMDNASDVLDWIINAFDNAEPVTTDTIALWDQSESVKSESIEFQDLQEKIGIPLLDDFCANLQRYLFRSDDDKLTQTQYIVQAVDELIRVAKTQNLDLAQKNGEFFCFNGRFWESMARQAFHVFLRNAAMRLGVPTNLARYHRFQENLRKQFHDIANFPFVQNDGVIRINLKSNTLEIREGQPVQTVSFDKSHGLCYQLGYDLNPDADCPLYQAFLERCVPLRVSLQIAF